MFRVFLSAFLLFTLHTQIVSAQGLGSGSSGTGLFGSRTFGQGISGGGNAAQNNGLTGAPGTNIEQLQAGAGTITGSERFIQENRQPGQFVGADTGEISNVRSQATSQGAGFQSLLNALSRPNQNQQQAGPQNNSSSRRQFRVQLRLGFKPDFSQSRVSTNFKKLLSRIPQVASASSINVSMLGRTAVLTGTAKSESERDLIARLARLEPGISSVKNDLVVGDESNDLSD